MPESRLDVLDRIYAGWGGGDFRAGSENLADDVQLVVDRNIPDGGVYVGPDGVRSYMRRFLGAWQSLTIAARGFEESADAVLVEVDQTGIGHGSGASVTMRYFQVWTFRGLEVTRMESILDEQVARRAAGLT